MPAEESDNHPDSRKWLRYLIHLRYISYIHPYSRKWLRYLIHLTNTGFYKIYIFPKKYIFFPPFL